MTFVEMCRTLARDPAAVSDNPAVYFAGLLASPIGQMLQLAALNGEDFAKLLPEAARLHDVVGDVVRGLTERPTDPTLN